MKVLFCLLHFGYHRNFEPVIRELARRGHRVHIAAEKADRDRAREVVEALAHEHPNITVGTLPAREKDQYQQILQRIRLGFDYLRYLEPTYRGMPGLRMRSEDRVPVGLLRLLEWPGMRTAAGRAALRAALRALERAAPTSDRIEAYLRAEKPDAIVVTPLIGVVTSSQLDYVATAKRLGIRTGFGVWSWDNLSSKALIRDIPDRVFVWNDTQREEAVRLHHVPPGQVVVSGAQCFDQWFGRAPSRTRAEFCGAVGLPPDKPYVLYVCSTMVWKSPSEAKFVVRWIRHLRASKDAVLRDAAILVRPHPGRLEEWDEIDLGEFDQVAMSGGPARGTSTGAAFPIDAESKADYFDALYHSSAVVGINTSAFIEAGIVGKPVYAILAEEYSGTQEGTIHFRYLTQVGGGVAQAGRAFDEHATQLAEALRGQANHEQRQKQFLEAFVRPQGLQVPATPVLTDAIEALGNLPGRPAVNRRASLVGGPPLRYLANVTSAGRGKLMLMTKDEFAAAVRNERPRTPRLHRLAERTRKRVKSVRKEIRRARKRTVNFGHRVAGVFRSS